MVLSTPDKDSIYLANPGNDALLALQGHVGELVNTPFSSRDEVQEKEREKKRKDRQAVLEVLSYQDFLNDFHDFAKDADKVLKECNHQCDRFDIYFNDKLKEIQDEHGQKIKSAEDELAALKGSGASENQIALKEAEIERLRAEQKLVETRLEILQEKVDHNRKLADALREKKDALEDALADKDRFNQLSEEDRLALQEDLAQAKQDLIDLKADTEGLVQSYEATNNLIGYVKESNADYVRLSGAINDGKISVADQRRYEEIVASREQLDGLLLAGREENSEAQNQRLFAAIGVVKASSAAQDDATLAVMADTLVAQHGITHEEAVDAINGKIADELVATGKVATAEEAVSLVAADARGALSLLAGDQSASGWIAAGGSALGLSFSDGHAFADLYHDISEGFADLAGGITETTRQLTRLGVSVLPSAAALVESWTPTKLDLGKSFSLVKGSLFTFSEAESAAGIQLGDSESDALSTVPVPEEETIVPPPAPVAAAPGSVGPGGMG